jgi:methionyl-tRNA synthetase
MQTRKILVTSALPYANGPLHLGHLVEVIQADIWVRFQKMRGHDCLFICGDDAHGTPIMIGAQKLGITPEQLINEINQQRHRDFRDFEIDFNNYYTTHSPENQQLSEMIYRKLQKNGDIVTRTISQAYDEVAQMFLPDRYVKGECPHCGAKDQYGDNCEVCGATYSPMDLKNPISTVSGTKPVQRESLHYFFRLENYTEKLRAWLTPERVQQQMIHKLDEWFKTGLQQWDISRDAPYFGFEIPDAPNKYFYVWLDAPVGYMASLQNLCERRHDLKFSDYWDANSEAELYHFVGKDIIYFHTLFWPAMLMGSGFRTPTAVWAHGFLTISGQKMSKSRGTFITAREYLDHLDPDYLRYYFAAKLTNSIEDIDFNFADFRQRINSDLVGKVVNIASRCANFIHKNFSNKLSDKLDQLQLYEHFVITGEKIAAHYEGRDYQQAVREIMALADLANQYIDEKKPWVLAKQPETLAQVQAVCSMGINLFYLLIVYLKPILPRITRHSETFLNSPPLTWESRHDPLLAHTINEFKPLAQRISEEMLVAFQKP